MKFKLNTTLSVAILTMICSSAHVYAACDRNYCMGQAMLCIEAAYAIENNVEGVEGIDLTPCFDAVKQDENCAGVNISLSSRAEFGGQRYVNKDGTQYAYLSCQGITNGVWLNKKD